MRFLLNAVYLAILAATLPYWLYRSWKTGKYRQGLHQRWSGSIPEGALARRGPGPLVWIHAVSVGEVMMVRGLVERLRSRRPDLCFAVSTATEAGMALARERHPEAAVFWAPFDFTWAVRRAMDSLDPCLLVLIELELWPNLLLQARQRGVPVAVANARLGEKSFRGYRRIRSLMRTPLSAIRWWGAQTEEYAQRIRDIAPGGTVAVSGSIKYDGALLDRNHPRTDELRRLLGFSPDDRVLLAGSTQSPEEEAALAAYLAIRRDEPRARLVIVPRHAERFEEVARLLSRRGVEFVRRSRIRAPRERSAPVTLVDSIGELGRLWAIAEMGFVGGSLDRRRGGQSMIEPAALGVPVCFGPHTWNFKETVRRLLELDAAARIEDAEEVTRVWTNWLRSPEEARAVGARARAFILAQQGSTDRTVDALASLLPESAGRKTA